MKPSSEWIKFEVFQQDQTPSDKEIEEVICLIQKDALVHAVKVVLDNPQGAANNLLDQAERLAQ